LTDKTERASPNAIDENRPSLKQKPSVDLRPVSHPGRPEGEPSRFTNRIRDQRSFLSFLPTNEFSGQSSTRARRKVVNRKKVFGKVGSDSHSEMWPARDRDVTEMWPRCDRDVSCESLFRPLRLSSRHHFSSTFTVTKQVGESVFFQSLPEPRAPLITQRARKPDSSLIALHPARKIAP